MKKFVFRLEGVLKLRRREEEAAQAAFATAQRGLLELRQAREVLQGALARNSEAPQSPHRQIAYLHRRHLRQRIEAAQVQEAQAEQGLARHRELLQKAMQARKALERLKEKQAEQHAGALRRSEQRQNDEAANRRAAQSEPEGLT